MSIVAGSLTYKSENVGIKSHTLVEKLHFSGEVILCAILLSLYVGSY